MFVLQCVCLLVESDCVCLLRDSLSKAPIKSLGPLSAIVCVFLSFHSLLSILRNFQFRAFQLRMYDLGHIFINTLRTNFLTIYSSLFHNCLCKIILVFYKVDFSVL